MVYKVTKGKRAETTVDLEMCKNDGLKQKT